ncbi:hypothetical protein GGR63_000116 [Xanthomonas sp. 3272]|uniref:hypothetical protein n=1 Tax=Xanthomonas arboricola TaxID=56448 RepID=UPI001431E06E|nr:hypothetical protein [Xanthomonas arboricola]NJC00229.1 hypothetical protein [Xanthomonas arboricola]
MTNKKTDTDKSKPLYPADANFPKTHFFYEYEGERAVDPAVLVEHGILLWHEQIYANELHDVSPLWAFAEAELEKQGQAQTHSDLEWLRQQVTVNALVPDSWNRLEPYPYKGLLIAALYLQEARRLCKVGDTGRVWHITALAYYNLGLNTTKSASHVFATYAAKEKADDSEYTRAIVLQVLKRLEDDKSITSVAQAKRAVIEFIQSYKDKKGTRVLLSELEKLDRLKPKRAKRSKTNGAIDRLENTLNAWAGRKSPYPEMAEAFAAFDRTNPPSASSEPPTSGPARTTSESFEFETADYHTRIFNLLANGDVVSLRLGHDKAQEQ